MHPRRTAQPRTPGQPHSPTPSVVQPKITGTSQSPRAAASIPPLKWNNSAGREQPQSTGTPQPKRPSALVPPVRMFPAARSMQAQMAGTAHAYRPAVSIPPVRMPNATGAAPTQTNGGNQLERQPVPIPPVRLPKVLVAAQPQGQRSRQTGEAGPYPIRQTPLVPQRGQPTMPSGHRERVTQRPLPPSGAVLQRMQASGNEPFTLAHQAMEGEGRTAGLAIKQEVRPEAPLRVMVLSDATPRQRMEHQNSNLRTLSQDFTGPEFETTPTYYHDPKVYTDTQENPGGKWVASDIHNSKSLPQGPFDLILARNIICFCSFTYDFGGTIGLTKIACGNISYDNPEGAVVILSRVASKMSKVKGARAYLTIPDHKAMSDENLAFWTTTISMFNACIYGRSYIARPIEKPQGGLYGVELLYRGEASEGEKRPQEQLKKTKHVPYDWSKSGKEI